MIGSVRGRLTLAVVVVVGAVAVMAALLAPRSVESALIDDRLDAEIAAERAALGVELVAISPSGEALGSPELTTLFGPDLAALTSTLDESGALDRLRTFRDDRHLVVAPVAGVLGDIDEDGRIRVDGRTPLSAGGPLITGRDWSSCRASSIHSRSSRRRTTSSPAAAPRSMTSWPNWTSASTTTSARASISARWAISATSTISSRSARSCSPTSSSANSSASSLTRSRPLKHRPNRFERWTSSSSAPEPSPVST